MKQHAIVNQTEDLNHAVLSPMVGDQVPRFRDPVFTLHQPPCQTQVVGAKPCDAWNNARPGKIGVLTDRTYGHENETMVPVSGIDPPSLGTFKQNFVDPISSPPDEAVGQHL